MKTLGLAVAFTGLLAFQLSPSALLAWQQTQRLQTGRTARLAVAPVDPRHILRGEYSRLTYQIARLDGISITDLPSDCLPGGAERCYPRQGSEIYVRLTPDAGGVARASGVQFTPPAEGSLFIKGRVSTAVIERDIYRFKAQPSQIPLPGEDACRTNCLTATVTYGIEQWYGEQGVPAKLDRMERNAILVDVRLGSDGTPSLDGLTVDGKTFSTTARLW